MTTQFTYLNKEYQVDIDTIDWYNKKDTLVKLPNEKLLTQMLSLNLLCTV
jgi:hypothetical protein